MISAAGNGTEQLSGAARRRSARAGVMGQHGPPPPGAGVGQERVARPVSRPACLPCTGRRLSSAQQRTALPDRRLTLSANFRCREKFRPCDVGIPAATAVRSAATWLSADRHEPLQSCLPAPAAAAAAAALSPLPLAQPSRVPAGGRPRHALCRRVDAADMCTPLCYRRASAAAHRRAGQLR